MSTEVYNIKKNNNEILLNIQLEVCQGALITPIVTLITTDRIPIEPLPESIDKNYQFSIGTANELEEPLISVEFVIDLNLINQGLWQQCFNQLNIEYTFSGGAIVETFEHNDDDIKVKNNNGKRIGTKKQFLLTL